jgi:beta-xylosidase
MRKASAVAHVSGLAALLSCAMLSAAPLAAAAVVKDQATWTADNGDGTFTNPLFYDEFSDPDLIRVGDDFYLTGTTMHAMPGLPVLHSKDLVNWEFLSYAVDKLDLGPAYRLQGGDIYGRGIWAPSFRYHDGVFYIFSNVNGETTQVFTATDPRGPWAHRQMKRSFHDLSVLFDDDGKAWVVWGYRDLKIGQLNADLTDIVPGTERTLFDRDAGMGEGSHLYKIDGRYFIISAWWDGRMRMPAARADSLAGPWEVNKALSMDEDFGLAEGYRLKDQDGPAFDLVAPNPEPRGRMSLHQGGVVRTPKGEWWGFSMLDYNSVGRLVALSPITWKDGWPYFGLPGNLGRTPRTWVKPKTDAASPIRAPYERSDAFDGARLKPVWQWNHVPDDTHWSLTERPGFLRLRTLPAASFWDARNSLTQRAIGPRSQPTVVLDAAGLKDGDIAGLALLNMPYAWIGVERAGKDLAIVQFDKSTGAKLSTPLAGSRIWLRADCDFLTEKARLRYSTDGVAFKPVGAVFTTVFSLRTFQGVRYALFGYNTKGVEGGHADFDSVTVHEPNPKGLQRPIPVGGSIRFTALGSSLGLSVAAGQVAVGPPSSFTVVDLGQGRVALKAGEDFVSVAPDGAVRLDRRPSLQARAFQWIETPTGDLVLMSLETNRFLTLDPKQGVITSLSPGPRSDGADGARLSWARDPN